MEKRILGIVLTILGIAGMIMAGVNFVNGVGGGSVLRATILYGVLGVIFFFAGIGLIRNTRDIAS